MEFDKSKVYTAVNADELQIGSKCIFADTVKGLRRKVEEDTYRVETFYRLHNNGGDDLFVGNDSTYSYAYLIEPPVEQRYKPFSSEEKELDFASFLAGLEKCGYGWAYRVLDAQYFGVPQRRRRVFVIGHSDNRTDLAAKVLFEPESMRRDFKKGGKIQKKPTGIIEKGIDYFRRGGNYKYHKDKKASTLRNSASPDCFDLVLASGKNIRHLTPFECERLQGFPDNYTQIEWNGKPKDQCPDSHRYKAIGNSMAVPVMRWIGERIKKIQGEMK